MIKGIIFDLDGTLLYTIKDITTAVNLTLCHFGYEQKDEEFVKLHTGNGFRKLIKDVLPDDVTEQRVDEVNDYYASMYGEHYMDETCAYEGISELLIKLQNLGIRLAVNSNKKDIYSKNLIKKIFGDIDFISVFGERENVPKKPDPAAAFEIIEMMGLEKDEIIYVGDSEVDMKTGRNAGIKTVACLWGFRNKEDIEGFSPEAMVKKPIEIYDYIVEEKL